MKTLLCFLSVMVVNLNICFSQPNKNGTSNDLPVTATMNKLIAEYKNIYFSLDTSGQQKKLSDLLDKITLMDPTIVNKCNVCVGSKKVKIEMECHICSGTGSTQCYNCINGQINCSPCNGFGKVYCSCAIKSPLTDLIGQFRYNPNCNVCRGNYGGRGFVNCNNCNGGKTTDCGKCRGSGGLTCNNCNNGYKIISTKCDDCKGLGRSIE